MCIDSYFFFVADHGVASVFANKSVCLARFVWRSASKKLMWSAESGSPASHAHTATTNQIKTKNIPQITHRGNPPLRMPLIPQHFKIANPVMVKIAFVQPLIWAVCLSPLTDGTRKSATEHFLTDAKWIFRM